MLEQTYIVKTLSEYNYQTGHKAFKYTKVTSKGVFIENGWRFNWKMESATKEEYEAQEERLRKLRQKPEPRPLKDGEKVINPWR